LKQRVKDDASDLATGAGILAGGLITTLMVALLVLSPIIIIGLIWSATH
jgi:hypothetical protein